MDEWKPRPKQRAVLEAAQTPGLNRTITAICGEAGVTRATFYRWIEKNEGFRDAWNNVWRWQIDRYMPSIVAAQVKQAQNGSTPAAKLLAELAEKMIRPGAVKLEIPALDRLLDKVYGDEPDTDEPDTTES